MFEVFGVWCLRCLVFEVFGVWIIKKPLSGLLSDLAALRHFVKLCKQLTWKKRKKPLAGLLSD